MNFHGWYQTNLPQISRILLQILGYLQTKSQGQCSMNKIQGWLELQIMDMTPPPKKIVPLDPITPELKYYSPHIISDNYKEVNPKLHLMASIPAFPKCFYSTTSLTKMITEQRNGNIISTLIHNQLPTWS